MTDNLITTQKNNEEDTINPEDYTFESQDKFQRKLFAESLIELLKQESSIFPIALNGRWGSGKTVFTHQIINLIKERYKSETIPLYFDAFSEDYSNEPLSSIFAKIYSVFGERDRDELIKITSEISFGLLGVSLSFINPLFANTADRIKKIILTAYNENLKAKSNLKYKIKVLKNLVNSKLKNRQIVLFIDELDRCRPDYALQILELTKHVFSIDKLKIVFVVNQLQLIESVKHAYGGDEEICRKYLDKFFQLQINLPETTKQQNQSRIKNSILHFQEELHRLKLHHNCFFFSNQSYYNTVFQLFIELIEAHNLSLRDVEKLTKHLLVFSLFNEQTKEFTSGEVLIKAFAIFQHTFNKKLYQNFLLSIDPFLSKDDFPEETRKDNDKFRSIWIVFLMIFEENHRILDLFFGNNPGAYTLQERRKILIETFYQLDSLF